MIGPCKGRSRDSGFKFQTDQGFWIQISERARFRIQISKRARFRIQNSTFWDSNFKAIFWDSYFKMAWIQDSDFGLQGPSDDHQRVQTGSARTNTHRDTHTQTDRQTDGIHTDCRSALQTVINGVKTNFTSLVNCVQVSIATLLSHNSPFSLYRLMLDHPPLNTV